MKESEGLKLGCAKVDITPEKPVALAGFAHRKGNFERIDRLIHARILFFGQGGGAGQALIVSADLICWDGELAAQLKSKLKQRWGLSEEQIVLHGTHSHSGPQVTGGNTYQDTEPDKDYLALLERRILEGAEEASRSMEPVSVGRGSGHCEIGVNRRKMVDGMLRMAPNPDGPVDHEASVVRFAAADGRTKGVLVHYACHPTTSGENTISSEYPGVAMDLVEEKLGAGAVSAFLQGFSADVRPALVRDGDFYRGANEEIVRFGQKLADEVLAVLGRPMKRLAPGTLITRELNVQLDLQEPPSIEELQRWADPGKAKAAGAEAAGSAAAGQGGEPAVKQLKQLAPDTKVLAAWSRTMLDERRYLQRSVELKLSYLALADGLSFVTANAEMAGDYGRFVKSRFGGSVLPVAYSNGMIGYVMTAGQLAEGGYEAVDYIYYFGLPAPLVPESDERIRKGISELAAKK